jgi:hypothetical protein
LIQAPVQERAGGKKPEVSSLQLSTFTRYGSGSVSPDRGQSTQTAGRKDVFPGDLGGLGGGLLAKVLT